MTLRTTYFSALSNEQVKPASDARVFAVVRYPQDWFDDLVDRNIRSLAPPKELLDAYKTVEEAADEDGEPNPSEVAWHSVNFAEQYREYVTTNASQVLDRVAEVAEETTVWLVCWEADDECCHRRLLADEIEQRTGTQSVGFSSAGMGRDCPNCENGCVCSVEEFKRVFRLGAREPDAKRVLENGADYICSACFTGFSGAA